MAANARARALIPLLLLNLVPVSADGAYRGSAHVSSGYHHAIERYCLVQSDDRTREQLEAQAELMDINERVCADDDACSSEKSSSDDEDQVHIDVVTPFSGPQSPFLLKRT